MRRPVALVVFFALVASGANHHSLPEKLISARAVFIQNDSGDVKLGDAINKTLKSWGRWQIVNDRSDADLIAVVDHKHTFIQDSFTLTLLDSKSSERIWSAKHEAMLKAEVMISRQLTADLRSQLPGKPSKPSP